MCVHGGLRGAVCVVCARVRGVLRASGGACVPRINKHVMSHYVLYLTG